MALEQVASELSPVHAAPSPCSQVEPLLDQVVEALPKSDRTMFRDLSLDRIDRSREPTGATIELAGAEKEDAQNAAKTQLQPEWIARP
jgi:hypothetical protein